jgi:hypothetical protein
MQEKHLYEYSVIRAAKGSEEFLNGDYCFAKKRSLKVIHSLDIQRTQSLSAEADVEQIQMNLLAFEK